MYNRTEIILEAYPYEFVDIQKGRGAYLCTDQDGGRKILKQFSGSAVKAELLNRFLTYLNERGVICEQIVRTKDGEILFTDVEDTRYYMRTWFEGRECDTRNRDDILCAVRKLAQLHCITAAFAEEMPRAMSRTPDFLQMEYIRHTRELHKVRNYIKSRKKKNEFETRFLAEYDSYILQAEDVADRLQAMGEVPKESCFGVCHGDYSHHNLIFTAQGPIVINYERFCRDAYVGDFAHFFRKIMEKHNWNIGLGMDLIRTYDRVRQMDLWERKQLYYRVAFPEKFWKVANHYFNSKKSWANNRDSEKLEKICAQEQQRMEFLKMLQYCGCKGM